MGEGGAAKQTLLGITTKKEVDLADWYSQVGSPAPTPISLGHCNPHSSSLLGADLLPRMLALDFLSVSSHGSLALQPVSSAVAAYRIPSAVTALPR